MPRQEGLIVITGPTGSGKTSLVFELSRHHPIEVISADSMQVYCYMDLATAKPSPEQLSALPHHLIDIVRPDQEFQAAMFVKMAHDKITEVMTRGKIPVIVGGTGLYIKALIYGLAPAPAREERIRKVLRSIIEKRGIAYLVSMLEKLDPFAASVIKKNDAIRVIRTLEIIFLTGHKVSNIYAKHGFSKPLFDARIACIMPERDQLFRNIDQRTVKMIDEGLLDETRRLLDMGYSTELHSMQTLAYKHAVRHLNGEIDLDETLGFIQRDTRRYAKRQITWMKARPDHIFLDSLVKAYEVASLWLDEQDRA
ncbi:MAG: tRNA (adenosine(37)-N6)-dimethylallyltransferase MiaA [Desulfomonilia bacterium]